MENIILKIVGEVFFMLNQCSKIKFLKIYLMDNLNKQNGQVLKKYYN